MTNLINYDSFCRADPGYAGSTYYQYMYEETTDNLYS